MMDFGMAVILIMVTWILGGISYHHSRYKLIEGAYGMSKTINNEVWKQALIPLYEVRQESVNILIESRIFDDKTNKRMLRDHDILSYFFEICTMYYCQQKIFKFRQRVKKNMLTPSNLEKLVKICDLSSINEDVSTNKNLIVICVESLESWTLEMVDENKNYVAPNLRKASLNATLYADKISSQARYGNSSDGQMTMITGLLPISYGAATMYYGDNKYPGWPHLYENDAIINPTPDAWNINVTTPSFGFRELIQPVKDSMWNDEDVTNILINVVDTIQEPFAVFAITQSMHVPFALPKIKKSLRFPSEMPMTMQNYLSCVHYTDSCIGNFLDSYEHTDTKDSTIIVITGDHTIFKPGGLLPELLPYAKKHNMSIAEGITYCPLLVLDSTKKKKMVSEKCYQMDIYPTILDATNVDGYYWKAFGRSLLDDCSMRHLTEDDAFELSDQLIRANYFSQIDAK